MPRKRKHTVLIDITFSDEVSQSLAVLRVRRMLGMAKNPDDVHYETGVVNGLGEWDKKHCHINIKQGETAMKRRVAKLFKERLKERGVT